MVTTALKFVGGAEGPKMSSDNRGQKRIYIRLQRRQSLWSIYREPHRASTATDEPFPFVRMEPAHKEYYNGARQIHGILYHTTNSTAYNFKPMIISFCFK